MLDVARIARKRAPTPLRKFSKVLFWHKLMQFRGKLMSPLVSTIAQQRVATAAVLRSNCVVLHRLSRTRQLESSIVYADCNRRDSTSTSTREKRLVRARRHRSEDYNRLDLTYGIRAPRSLPIGRNADRRGDARIFKATCLRQRRRSARVRYTTAQAILHSCAQCTRTGQSWKLKRPSARSGPGTVSKDRNVRSNCRCSCVLQFTS